MRFKVIWESEKWKVITMKGTVEGVQADAR